MGAARREAFEPVSGGEHHRDDGGGERLIEQESAADRQDRDDVDARLMLDQVGDDRRGEPDGDEQGREGPGTPGEGIVAAECRHEAEHQATGRDGEHRALGENAERP